jgi:hypothetical protein
MKKRARRTEKGMERSTRGMKERNKGEAHKNRGCLVVQAMAMTKDRKTMINWKNNDTR